MKTKIVVLLVAAFVAYTLKRHYSEAGADALWWILAPTASVVSLVTGSIFTHVPGEGYLSTERLFLIEKACAGINFMIAAFALVTFALRHRAKTVRTGSGVLGAAILASYGAALIVNTARIIVAMWLVSHPVAPSIATAADVHRLEGITVYFAGLVMLHELVKRVDGGAVSSRVAS